MRSNRFFVALTAMLSIFTVTLLVTITPAVAQETILYSFTGGSDGSSPNASLIFDAVGNLYGTTVDGGAYNAGTVFELIPQAGGGWTEKVLHSFGNGTDGFLPWTGLIFDAAGNLYGTTVDGGAYRAGTVFELTPQAGGGWAEKVLHNFRSGTADGSYPYAGAVLDAVGNLYGTTSSGGVYNQGTVFELSPKTGGGWTETLLFRFGNDNDGTDPQSVLTFDAVGNLFGTTATGGAHQSGLVFELSPKVGGGWKETLPVHFNIGKSPNNPFAGVTFDQAGNLYGTTYFGGAYGYGTVFEATPLAGGGWAPKVLHAFGNRGDGTEPYAGLILDASGNLYGTTSHGGAGGSATGTVFELTPRAGGTWSETVLHSFNAFSGDGQTPYGGLIFDAAGNLYGTTTLGGVYGHGTVFEIKP